MLCEKFVIMSVIKKIIISKNVSEHNFLENLLIISENVSNLY